MVDKIGSKRTAERMDKWVELHTNNKFLYSSLMFTNRSLLSATYGSGFRVSAELSLFLFIIIILSRLLFWLLFFFRARARQGNLVPPPNLSPIEYTSHLRSKRVTTTSIHPFFVESSWEEESGEEERKKLFRWGG